VRRVGPQHVAAPAQHPQIVVGIAAPACQRANMVDMRSGQRQRPRRERGVSTRCLVVPDQKTLRPFAIFAVQKSNRYQTTMSCYLLPLLAIQTEQVSRPGDTNQCMISSKKPQHSPSLSCTRKIGHLPRGKAPYEHVSNYAAMVYSSLR
jgi:hypothetical protein